MHSRNAEKNDSWIEDILEQITVNVNLLLPVINLLNSVYFSLFPFFTQKVLQFCFLLAFVFF